MTETPPRLRSFAPPTRDKMIIWSAVVAGCGIMALLGRYAAIYRFDTDEFTGNILFAVFFSLAYISVFNLYLRQSSRDCFLSVHLQLWLPKQEIINIIISFSG